MLSDAKFLYFGCGILCCCENSGSQSQVVQEKTIYTSGAGGKIHQDITILQVQENPVNEFKVCLFVI